MKVLVAVKQVGSLDDDFELTEDETGVDRDFLDFSLNEWDRFSVEAALALVEASGGEVVVMTLGDEESEEALRIGLAMGAHRAVRISDEDGSFELAGPLAVARVLAAAIEREEPELVLFGAQASDTSYGATGVACAAYLGIPGVALVRSIQVSGDTLQVERELDGGVVESLEVDLPALLTVQSGINDPRYVTLRAVQQASAIEIDLLELQDLGLDADALLAGRIVRMFAPEQAASAEMITGSPDEVAARIRTIIDTTLAR